HLYISANTPHFWNSLCELIGLPELAQNERYDTVKKRAAHVDELVPVLRQALKQKTAAEWEALFRERVPCSVVRRVEDVFEDAHVLEQRLIAEHVHPGIGRYKTIPNPTQFSSAERARNLRPAYGLSEHSVACMRDL